MKKSKKIISLSLAALLAVSPIMPAITIKAAAIDQNASNATAVTDQPYFTYNGKRLADGATIPITGLPFKSGDTVDQVVWEALKAVDYHANGKTYKGGAGFNVTTNLDKELRSQNITVNGPDGNEGELTGDINGFTITLEGRNHYDGNTYNGKPATVVIPFGTGVAVPSNEAPQVEFQQDGKDTKLPINGQFFQVVKGAKFNPLDFTASDGTEYKITDPNADLSVTENPVDTSKAGSSSIVRLSATNKKTGKKITVSYTVLISPQSEQTLHVKNWIPAFNLDPQTKLPAQIGSAVFRNGDKFLVTNETKIYDGASYTKVKPSPSSSSLIRTFDLVNSSKDSTPKKAVTKMVMHKAIIYNDKGKATSKTIPAFKKIKVNPVHQSIGSQAYYELTNKSGYIKVGNIDGTKRVLIHNAYIYRSSNRRANSKVLKGWTKATTYGGSFKFKNGKRYYRVGGPSKQYVKVNNFHS